jgi:hypothetical protein
VQHCAGQHRLASRRRSLRWLLQELAEYYQLQRKEAASRDRDDTVDKAYVRPLRLCCTFANIDPGLSVAKPLEWS